MPKPMGPKKRKKVQIKKEKKRQREAEARAQLVGRTVAEEQKLKQESEILGRQRIKRPERNPKRENRFSGSSEPPVPPPQLLDAIHEFLLDYRYIKAAHGMRTDNQKRPGHSQDVWKWTSKGLPFLSDLFIQWKDQNPGTVEQAAIERKRWLQERERWKAETNEAKRQKKELKRKRRDMAQEVRRLELEKDFDAVALMKKKLHQADKAQNRLDGYQVSEDSDSGGDNASGSDTDGEEPRADKQTNMALDSGSESDDESEASGEDSGSSDESTSDEEDEDDAEDKVAQPATNGTTSKTTKPSVNGLPTTGEAAAEDDSDSSSSSDAPSDSSSSEDEDETAVKPVVNGTASSRNEEAASSSASTPSASSSEDDSDSASSSTPEESAPATAPKSQDSKKRKAPASSSSSSDSDSDPTPPPQPAVTTATTSKKRKAPTSSSSSSSSSSDSDSDSDSDSSGGAPLPKKVKVEETVTATTNGTPAKNGLGKGIAKPFSRIPDNIKVNDKFASNEYVDDDYGRRSNEKLSVVRGKGFTKEKNKMKKGQGFRGGRIDIESNRAIRFDD